MLELSEVALRLGAAAAIGIALGINRDLAGTGPNGDNGDEGDHGASWLDFDHDGLLDLVIENSAYVGSHAWLYRQNADHTFTNVIDLSGVANSIGNSNGLSVDDYDRDGDLDVVMGSVNTGSGMADSSSRSRISLRPVAQVVSTVNRTAATTSGNHPPSGILVMLEAK